VPDSPTTRSLDHPSFPLPPFCLSPLLASHSENRACLQSAAHAGAPHCRFPPHLRPSVCTPAPVLNFFPLASPSPRRDPLSLMPSCRVMTPGRFPQPGVSPNAIKKCASVTLFVGLLISGHSLPFFRPTPRLPMSRLSQESFASFPFDDWGRRGRAFVSFSKPRFWYVLLFHPPSQRSLTGWCNSSLLSLFPLWFGNVLSPSSRCCLFVLSPRSHILFLRFAQSSFFPPSAFSVCFDPQRKYMLLAQQSNQETKPTLTRYVASSLCPSPPPPGPISHLRFA